MTNWCENKVFINASKEILDEIIKAIESKNLLNHFIPFEHNSNDVVNIMALYQEKWGTKWEPQELTYLIMEDGTLFMEFNTAWGPPIPLYKHFHDKGIKVEAYYYSMESEFGGTFIDGTDSFYSEDEFPNILYQHFDIDDY